jgi:hypothetical protein
MIEGVISGAMIKASADHDMVEPGQDRNMIKPRPFHGFIK